MQGKPRSGLLVWEELLAVDVCDLLAVVVLAFWLRRMSFALC